MMPYCTKTFPSRPTAEQCIEAHSIEHAYSRTRKRSSNKNVQKLKQPKLDILQHIKQHVHDGGTCTCTTANQTQVAANSHIYATRRAVRIYSTLHLFLYTLTCTPISLHPQQEQVRKKKNGTIGQPADGLLFLAVHTTADRHLKKQRKRSSQDNQCSVQHNAPVLMQTENRLQVPYLSCTISRYGRRGRYRGRGGERERERQQIDPQKRKKGTAHSQ